jgi:hypothetical protein
LIPFCLAGCRSAGIAECTEAGECPAPQTCNRHTRLCYTPDPVFAVDITQPVPNAAQGGPEFHLAGNVLNAAEDVLVQYQVADAGWTSIPVSASGHFEAYPPSPQADGTQVTVSVRATQTSGEEALASVPFVLDNVGPVATLSVVDQERGHPLNIAVDFSEPVLPEDPDTRYPLTLSPAAGAGEWNQSKTQFRVTGLLPDTHYVAQVNPNVVRDAAGNKNVEVHAEFRTRPAVPDGGFALPAPAGLSFNALDARSDQDGVLTLAADATDGTLHQIIWGWFDPGTGGFISHVISTGPIVSTPTPGISVGASVADPLDSPRIHTLTVREQLEDGGVAPHVFWSSGLDDGGIHSQLSGALAIVPGAPGCGEPGEPDDVARVLDAGTPTYQRAGPPIALAFAPDWIDYASPESWSAVAVSGEDIQIQSLQYACDAGTVPLADGGSIYDPLGSGSVTNVSSAAVVVNDLLAYDVGSTRQLACAVSSSTGTLGGALSTSPGITLASLHQDGWVLGARIDPVSQVLSLERADIDQKCPPSASDWLPVATVPDSADLLVFRPALIGDTPGLVYLNGTGQLSLFKADAPFP